MTTWVEDIVKAIMEVGGVAHLSEIYEYIKQNTTRNAKVAWKQNTRQRIYDNSTDASQYKGPEDIFYLVGKLRSGIWGVRREWLESKGKAVRVQSKRKGASVDSTTTTQNMLTGEEDALERIGRTTYQLSRNATRAARLKELYEYSCQVCGMAIQLVGRLYAETHHIKPRNEHNGKDFWDNMIVLCPNHHVEFDKGVLCVDPRKLCFLHKLDNSINGKKVPMRGEHQLKREYLEYAKRELFD